jgi:hypothetical protein
MPFDRREILRATKTAVRMTTGRREPRDLSSAATGIGRNWRPALNAIFGYNLFFAALKKQSRERKCQPAQEFFGSL